MWAVYVHHVPSGPNTFVHKGRVVAVHDTEVTVKRATDKNHGSFPERPDEFISWFRKGLSVKKL